MSFLRVILCLAVTVTFVKCIMDFYPETDFHVWGYVMFGVLYLIVFLANTNMYHCFEVGSQRRREFVFSYAVAVLLTNFIMFFVISLLCKYIVSPVPLLLATLFQILVGSAILMLSNMLFFILRPMRKAAVVCSPDQHESQVLEKFRHVRDNYTVEGVYPETDDPKDLIDKISSFDTIICGQISAQARESIVRYCFENNKRLFIVPSVQDIILNNTQQTFVGDSVVYLCRNRIFTAEQLIIKRLCDILISLFGIILTSPLMLITALLIKIQDGGPVFFRQERYTRNFNRFMIIKFRSMVVDAEKHGAQFTTPNDPRITPVGRFIRATRIDELPQFFNILKGDMSLVGPRAERIENVDYYCQKMPEFKYRMKVKAGLTGYAQIYGRYNTSYEDKLKLDLLYIENASLMQDFQLLFQTVRVLFIPSESTEGFDDSTIDEMEKKDS